MKFEEWVKSLTADQRMQLASCETAEQIATYCKEHGIELPDELIESASGGVDLCEDGSVGSGVPCPKCHAPMRWLDIENLKCPGCGYVTTMHQIIMDNL